MDEIEESKECENKQKETKKTPRQSQLKNKFFSFISNLKEKDEDKTK